MCKFAYAPVLLIYFLIPKEKFESQKLRYKAFAWAAVILVLFVFAVVLCKQPDNGAYR